MVVFIGDVHGKYERYGKLLKECRGSIQVGDMGVGFRRFPHGEEQANPPYDKMVCGQHRFIRGNHDNPGVCRRHTQCIKDGSVINDVMFVGGAKSIDRMYRIEDFSWWQEEELNYQQFQKIVEIYMITRPRVMVTHDCPGFVYEAMGVDISLYGGPSITNQALNSMHGGHVPELWIFGHHHASFDNVVKGTRFVCLAELEAREFDVDLGG